MTSSTTNVSSVSSVVHWSDTGDLFLAVGVRMCGGRDGQVPKTSPTSLLKPKSSPDTIAIMNVTKTMTTKV